MKPVLSLILLLSFFACKAQQPEDNRTREIVFRNVNVIPMDKERVITNQTVVVKNGMVTAMGSGNAVKHSSNAMVIDATGKYLIPGLAEMHAHVPPVDDIEPMKEVLMLFAANGITTIRGMLGHPRHIELRGKIQSGEILGPRFYTSGPSFNGNSVKTPEAGAEMVRQQKQAGYDFLKLHPGLTKENFAAIAKTAKEAGIPFAGHVSFDVGVWRAIDAGYATIDHLDGFTESLVPGMQNIKEQDAGLFGMFIGDKADASRIPKLVQGLKEHNIWVVPTQALAERWFTPDKDADAFRKDSEMKYMKIDVLNGWVNTKKNLMGNPKYDKEAMGKYIQLRRKLIYDCYKGGVGILLGSDAPQVFDVPGFSAHHELRYYVDAGLTPYEALTTGTVNVARFYNKPDWGIIKTGAVSDLVLLNGNPLPDINQVGNIEGVMLGNYWLSKTYIQEQLKKLVKQ